YITPYPNRIPLISKEDFINKFGKPEGYSDDEGDDDKSAKPSPSELSGFYQSREELNSDDDDDNDDDDEFDMPDVKAVLSENVSRYIKRAPSGKYFLELNDKYDIWFEYILESNVMRISDDGAAFTFTSLSDRRIKNAIKKFPQVQYDEHEVFIDVLKPADTFKSVLTLYSVLDYLFKLN
ncbi:MAG: hypothetical protein K2I75_06230, partial [Clostridiales bacterium]|nr:hypothetical protein [Clostridiales bacterium]